MRAGELWFLQVFQAGVLYFWGLQVMLCFNFLFEVENIRAWLQVVTLLILPFDFGW